MSGGKPGWGNWDPDAWAKAIGATYPEIESLYLVGSRAAGAGREDSDWDVVAVLRESCYGQDGEPIDPEIERRITEDPENAFDGLDLFFIRPGERHFRWDEGQLAEVPMLGGWWQQGRHCRHLYGRRLTNDEPIKVVPLRGDSVVNQVRDLRRA